MTSPRPTAVAASPGCCGYKLARLVRLSRPSRASPPVRARADMNRTRRASSRSLRYSSTATKTSAYWRASVEGLAGVYARFHRPVVKHS